MELKYLDSFKCYRILTDCGGSPAGVVADGRMGVGVGMGVCGVSYACMHAHTYMIMDASMSAAISNFYTCIHVHVCVHACASACMWGHPHAPPQSHREPKTPNFNNSWN